MEYGAAGEVSFCSDCRQQVAAVLDHATGDTICTECGLVLDSRFIDETCEWRTFANEDGGGGGDHNPCRVGRSVDQLLDSGRLFTSISQPHPRSNANNGKKARTPWMLPSGTTADRALVTAFRGIAELADRLGIVAASRDQAKEVFKKLVERKLILRGRNTDAVYAACLFIACRQESTPRSLKEISSAVFGGGASKNDVARVVTLLKNHLGEELGHTMGVVRASDYLRRFCSSVGMGSPELIWAAQEALRRVEKLDVRRNPESVAAAVVYMVGKESGAKRSVREVSAATGVAEGTIQEACKDLSMHAMHLFGTPP